jgi:hypothetical protein
MRIYLAGPMRGLRDWNFPAFDLAERLWRGAGHQPFSPAATCRVLGYALGDGTDPAAPVDDGHLRHVMSMDIACIMAADAIGLLPGWEDSTGATLELALAQFLGLGVYDALTMYRMYPPTRPWRFAGGVSAGVWAANAVGEDMAAKADKRMV